MNIDVLENYLEEYNLNSLIPTIELKIKKRHILRTNFYDDDVEIYCTDYFNVKDIENIKFSIGMEKNQVFDIEDSYNNLSKLILFNNLEDDTKYYSQNYFYSGSKIYDVIIKYYELFLLPKEMEIKKKNYLIERELNFLIEKYLQKEKI